MRTLIDYYFDKQSIESCKADRVFPLSYVSDCFANVLKEGNKELLITDEEFFGLQRVYDQQLPWDWNGKEFRGVKLIRIKDQNG